MTTKQKTGLEAILKVLFMVGCLIATGWFIDDRIDAKINRVFSEIKIIKTDVKQLSIDVAHINGRLEK